MSWSRSYLSLIILSSHLFVLTFCFCEMYTSVDCLSSEGDGCEFIKEQTIFNYSLIDEKNSEYAIELLLKKNACGFHKYIISVELIEYAKSSEQCNEETYDENEDIKNVGSIDIPSEECSNVKLGFNLKYLFSGCYVFVITPFIETNSQRNVMHHVWIQNNFTFDDYRLEKPLFKPIALNPFEVSWKFTPGTFSEENANYSLKIKYNDVSFPVPNNQCTLLGEVVTCQLHNLTQGQYVIIFDLINSWRCCSAGFFGSCSWAANFTKPASSTISSEYKFNVPVEWRSKYLDWIVLGLLVIICTLTIGIVLWYRRYKMRNTSNIPIEIYSKYLLKKHVKGILLLYARDCQVFMETMAELRKYVMSRTKVKVYDIFDPNQFDDIATSPNEFVESLLQDPHINVIVISTECFEHLYQSMLKYYSLQSNHGKEVSNLNQLYRKPHWLDGLVMHSLKLMSYDTSPTSYKKFYVVRLPKFNGSGNYLVHINPCTRFDIPGGLDTLIEKASPHSHDNNTLISTIENRENLHKTLYNLYTFVLNNPNYLYRDILRNKEDYDV